MGYQPACVVADCPACGSQPDTTWKSMFRPHVRLECQCGVAGQWVRDGGHGHPRNVAATGWEKVAGKPDHGQPPPPRR